MFYFGFIFQLPVQSFINIVANKHGSLVYESDAQTVQEEDPFKKECLLNMMGGVLEVTWQEQLQGELNVPKFLVSTIFF